MIIFLSMCYKASNDAALAAFLFSEIEQRETTISDGSATTGRTATTMRRIAISYDDMEACGDASIYGLLWDQIRTHNSN